MLTDSQLKSQVDRLWNMFWTGGLTNPLDAIEHAWLEAEGNHVLRFWNVEVIQNLEGILQVIESQCQRLTA